MLREAAWALCERCGVREGDSLLVGVSGGADSVALLCFLVHLRASLRLHLTLAHLNHQLRGIAADEDERFVLRLAARQGVEAVFGRRPVTAWAAAAGESIEMAARRARRDFFKATAEARGIRILALAHNADDQAETVLMRLARGAGPRGLGGMTWVGRRDGLRIVRPFLGLRREVLRRFLQAHRLEWREDESNRDDRYLRVRVRREVLPLLETRLNSEACQAICRAAELLRDESEAMDRMARKAGARCASGDALEICRLRKLPSAIRRRVLIGWICEHPITRESRVGRVSFGVVERLLRWVEAGKGKAPLDDFQSVEIRRGKLVLRASSAPCREGFHRALSGPGEVELPGGLCFRMDRTVGYNKRREAGLGRWPVEAWIRPPREDEAPLGIRSWLAGDRFSAWGGGGTRKIQDVFTDERLPREERGTYPLLVSGETVVWIPGYRIARDWAVPTEIAASLRLRIRKTDELCRS